MDIPPWHAGLVCWTILFAGLLLGWSLCNAGLRNAAPVLTGLGYIVLAALLVWSAPAFGEGQPQSKTTPDADLEALVANGQARASALEQTLAPWIDDISHRGERFSVQARSVADVSAHQIDRGLGLMSGPAFQGADAPTGQIPSDGAIYVAISLSMPKAALLALAKDAHAAGAKLVIRGLVNGSFKDTFNRAREVFDDRTAGGLAIDPQIFRAFAITSVPTFIAARTTVEPCGGLSCISIPPPHDQIAGDISLRAALRQLVTSGDQAPDVAARGLKILGD